MAESDDAKLDELKRLLRRLDKALPPSPSEEAAQASSDAPDRRQLATLEAGPLRLAAPASGRRRTALRTVAVAGGVSMVVSLSVAGLLYLQMLSAQRPVGPDRLASDVPATDAPASDVPAADQPVHAPAAPAAASMVPVVEKPHPTEITETASVSAPAAGTPADAHPSNPPVSVARDPVSSPPPEPAPTAPPAPAANAEPLPASSSNAEDVMPPAAAPLEAAPPSKPGEQSVAALGPPADRPLVELDAAQFLQRGLAMLGSGSVSAAQLLLERAADLGNGDAAFALATTYDGAPGAPRQGSEVRPNAELALRWYERAGELGVDEARKRLAALRSEGAAPAGDVR